MKKKLVIDSMTNLNYENNIKIDEKDALIIVLLSSFLVLSSCAFIRPGRLKRRNVKIKKLFS